MVLIVEVCVGQVPQRVKHVGQAELDIVGVDGLFTERVGYPGQVIVAVKEITGSVASRVGLRNGVILAVVVLVVPLTKSVFTLLGILGVMAGGEMFRFTWAYMGAIATGAG